MDESQQQQRTVSTYIKKRAFLIINTDKFHSSNIKINLNIQEQFAGSHMNGFHQIIYKSPSYHIDGLTLETPWMYISKSLYKINQGNDKSFVELTFKNIEKDSQIYNFFTLIQDIDHHIISKFAGYNTQLVYGKNIRMSDLSDSNPSYPYIKLKLNIIQKYVEFNNVQYKNIKQFFESVNISDSVAKCYIHCSGIWNYNGRLGMTWKIISMKINKEVSGDLPDDLLNPPFDEFLEDEHIVHIPNFECEVDDDEFTP
jgi:hypothetical protein